MCYALKEHYNYGKRDTANGFFDGPAVDEDAGGDDYTHCEDRGAQTVFGDSLAAEFDPFADGVVGPAATKECS